MLDENKIVLVDIDEVMWLLLDSWINQLNSKYNLEVRPTDCTAWDMKLLFPTLTYEQILEPLHQPGFWDTVTPRKDAQKYIAKLQEDGFTVRVVSATSFITASEKIQALRKHFPSINNSDIILCERKELVRGNFLIDDNINNLHYRRYPILMGAYHNRYESIPDHIYKVNTWKDAYTYIKSKVEKS